MLAHAGLPARPALHARALAAAGKLARARRDHGAARPLLVASLDLYRGLGDQAGAAAAARDLGMVTARAGDLDGGLEALGASLATFRALGDRWETAESLNLLATLTRDRGDHAAALPLFEESLALYRQAGDRRGEGSALQALGNMALGRGRLRPGPRLVDAVPGPHGRPGPPPRHHDLPLNLALGALLQARHDVARGHGEALLALGRDHVLPLATAWGRGVLGAVALAEGDRSGRGPASAMSWRLRARGPAGRPRAVPPWRGPWAARPALAAAERQAARAVRLAAAAATARRLIRARPRPGDGVPHHSAGSSTPGSHRPGAN